MSEIIENARREKQDVLKGIIRELHAGVPVEKLRKTFAALIKNTSPEEIADMGERPHSRGFPVEEVQRLCDVHAQVFDKALKKAGKRAHPRSSPLLVCPENMETASLLKELKRAAKPLVKGHPDKADIDRFSAVFARFKEIEKHYARKENSFSRPWKQRASPGRARSCGANTTRSGP